MLAQNYTAAEFLAAMQALMPRGRVWPRDATAVQTAILSGLAPSYERQTARSNNLLIDAFPATAVELLPEWEATLGLPSPAAGPAPTIEARQTLVLARFIGIGGQSYEGLEAYAALLGYTITISGNAPFRCGQSHCGDHLGTAEQMFVLTITAPAATETVFGAYGQAVLQYELQRVVSPFAVLQFNFT